MNHTIANIVTRYTSNLYTGSQILTNQITKITFSCEATEVYL